MLAQPNIGLKQTSTGCEFLKRLKLSCPMMCGTIMNSCTCKITCDFFQNRGENGHIWITIFSTLSKSVLLNRCDIPYLLH